MQVLRNKCNVNSMIPTPFLQQNIGLFLFFSVIFHFMIWVGTIKNRMWHKSMKAATCADAFSIPSNARLLEPLVSALLINGSTCFRNLIRSFELSSAISPVSLSASSVWIWNTSTVKSYSSHTCTNNGGTSLWRFLSCPRHNICFDEILKV